CYEAGAHRLSRCYAPCVVHRCSALGSESWGDHISLAELHYHWLVCHLRHSCISLLLCRASSSDRTHFPAVLAGSQRRAPAISDHRLAESRPDTGKFDRIQGVTELTCDS